ncbi:hypothetical protein GCM10020000_47450 [Streptomyces olivoverticillatus]
MVSGAACDVPAVGLATAWEAARGRARSPAIAAAAARSNGYLDKITPIRVDWREEGALGAVLEETAPGGEWPIPGCRDGRDDPKRLSGRGGEVVTERPDSVMSQAVGCQTADVVTGGRGGGVAAG